MIANVCRITAIFFPVVAWAQQGNTAVKDPTEDLLNDQPQKVIKRTPDYCETLGNLLTPLNRQRFLRCDDIAIEKSRTAISEQEKIRFLNEAIADYGEAQVRDKTFWEAYVRRGRAFYLRGLAEADARDRAESSIQACRSDPVCRSAYGTL